LPLRLPSRHAFRTAFKGRRCPEDRRTEGPRDGRNEGLEVRGTEGRKEGRSPEFGNGEGAKEELASRRERRRGGRSGRAVVFGLRGGVRDDGHVHGLRPIIPT
jgi:hypothetical protein